MTKFIAKLFLFLQLILILSFFLGRVFLPSRMLFSGLGLKELEGFPLLWSRANFDGFYYAKIARDGYQYLQQAFFPFYPQLIRLFQPIFRSYILSGLFISNLAFVLMVVVFWQLLKLEGIEEKKIKAALMFWAFFPTAFYFLSLYSESLFLFLALLSFYLARRKRFFWAGLVAGFASYTRPVGVLLFPALLVEYYEEESRRRMKERLLALKERIIHPWRSHLFYLLRSRWPHLKNTLYLSLSLGGILKYMYYLKRTEGDWFYFAHVQPGFGAQRTVNKLILLYQVFWRYLKMIFTVAPRQWLYFNVWFEFVIALVFLGLLLWGWYKRKEYRLRSSWLTFATAAYLLPTLTGTFSSLPRYVLVCFPCFLILSQFFSQKNSRLGQMRRLYWGISLALLILSSMLFFSGYWLA